MSYAVWNIYIQARIHKGGLSTNLGFRTSYDAFYAFFTNLVCKEQKEVWRNKKRFELKPWSELKPCFVNSGLNVCDFNLETIVINTIANAIGIIGIHMKRVSLSYTLCPCRVWKWWVLLSFILSPFPFLLCYIKDADRNPPPPGKHMLINCKRNMYYEGDVSFYS